MATKQSQKIIKHQTNIIILVYSDLLKNKIGGFLYDPTLNIYSIQKDKLISTVDINHLKIYTLHNATLSTVGSVEIPILCHSIKFNVIIHEIGTGISGVIGIVYYVPRCIMRIITRRATKLAGDRSRGEISSASILIEFHNYPNCVHWHIFYFM